MTHDLIDRLVRPANPVPNPAMLDADSVSAPREQWRTEVQQQQVDIEQAEERPSGGSGRGLLIGIAAGVAVVVGAFALFQATDPVASQSPVEIATEYVEAYAAFDVDAVQSMLAEDAEVLPWEAYEPRPWQDDLRYLEAAGFQILLGQCAEMPPPTTGLWVACDYEAHGLGSDQIGLDPFGGHVFRISIENGQVTHSDMGFDFTEFSEVIWWPFQRWINENHPDDFEVLYDGPGLSRQTEESRALWEQRIQDYIEYVKSES